MAKGKFGFSLWLYPFIAMWTVLVGPSLASVLILGFVLGAEKDEWAVKQCIHVVMFNIYWNVYKTIMGFLSGIPLLGMVLSVIDVIVFIVMLVLILILGLGRLKNGYDIGLPGRGIVNRAYGLMQSVPMYQQVQQQPQYQQPQQHYPQPQPPVYPQPPMMAPPPAQSELRQPPPPPSMD